MSQAIAGFKLFEALPTLETPRLRLRPLAESDADDFHRMLGDPDVVRYVPMRQSMRLSDTRRVLADMLACYARNVPAPWGVERRADGRLLGMCGFQAWAPGPARAEFGFLFAREAWGQGYAREASRAVMAFAFGPMGVNRLEARTKLENLAARRLLERLGLVHEGVLREHDRWKGQAHDLVLYAMLRREYQPDP